MSSPPVNNPQDDQNERRSAHIDPLIQHLHETMGRLFQATIGGNGNIDFTWPPSFPTASWRGSDDGLNDSNRESSSRPNTEPAPGSSAQNQTSVFFDTHSTLSDDEHRRRFGALHSHSQPEDHRDSSGNDEFDSAQTSENNESTEQSNQTNESPNIERTQPSNASEQSPRQHRSAQENPSRQGTVLYYISLVQPNGPQQASESALQKLKAVPLSEIPVDARHCSICYEPYTDPSASELEVKSTSSTGSADQATNSATNDATSADVVRGAGLAQDTTTAPNTSSAPVHVTSPATVSEMLTGPMDLSPAEPFNEEAAQKTEEDPHFPLQMPCGHTFGASCLRSWLKQSVSCPLCRTDIEPHQPHHHHARVSRFPVWFNPEPTAFTNLSQSNDSPGSSDTNTDNHDDTASQVMINLFPPLLSMARAFGLEEGSRTEPRSESGPASDSLNANSIPANGTDVRRWSFWNGPSDSYESLRRQQSQIMNRAARIAQMARSSNQNNSPDTSRSTSASPSPSLSMTSETANRPSNDTSQPPSASPSPAVSLPQFSTYLSGSHLLNNLHELAQAERNQGPNFDTSVDENLFNAFRNHFNDSELRFDANTGIPRPPNSPLHSVGSEMSDSGQSETASSQAPSRVDTPAGSRDETPERSGPSRRGGQRQHPYRRT